MAASSLAKYIKNSLTKKRTHPEMSFPSLVLTSGKDWQPRVPSTLPPSVCP
jgi:hypothetical protein